MPKRRWTLPLALGLITAVLLVAALWPKETPQAHRRGRRA